MLHKADLQSPVKSTVLSDGYPYLTPLTKRELNFPYFSILSDPSNYYRHNISVNLRRIEKFLIDIPYIDFRMPFGQNVVLISAGKYREMSVLQGGF